MTEDSKPVKKATKIPRDKEPVGKTQHERNTSHQNATGIKPCPNPKCGKSKVVMRGPLDDFFHVQCEKCGLIGPRHKDSLTSINLWNGLPRHGEPYGERCLFWHDWSKWADHNNQSRTTRLQDGTMINKGDYLVQIRTCKRCGNKEFQTKRIFDVDYVEDTKDKKG